MDQCVRSARCCALRILNTILFLRVSFGVPSAPLSPLVVVIRQFRPNERLAWCAHTRHSRCHTHKTCTGRHRPCATLLSGNVPEVAALSGYSCAVSSSYIKCVCGVACRCALRWSATSSRRPSRWGEDCHNSRCHTHKSFVRHRTPGVSPSVCQRALIIFYLILSSVQQLR